MRRKSLVPLLLALVMLVMVAGPALAGEVIYFSNGTSLPVEAYSIEDGTISVLLGGQSYFAFPLDQVDRIETASGDVDLSTERQANRMVPSPTTAIQTGITPARYRGGKWGTDVPAGRGQRKNVVHTDKNGLAVYRPFGANAPKNKRNFSMTGRRGLASAQGGGPAGTSGRAGARYVLPAGVSSGQPRRQPVGITMNGGGGGGGGGESSEDQ